MDMTYSEFLLLAGKHKMVPVYKQILADLLTPISAYLRLSQNSKYSFLFESVEKGTRFSRYSYIGRNPQKIINFADNKTTITENNLNYESPNSYLDNLRTLVSSYSSCQISGFPGFTGGVVGYLGYECIRLNEDIPIYDTDELGVPDSVFMVYEDIIVFDHLKNRIIVFSNVNTETDDLPKAYAKANQRIDELGDDLHTDIDYQSPVKLKRSKIKFETTLEEFTDVVKQAKDHIKSGDIFQVVLSQRFQRKTNAKPVDIYRALRSINPSPYLFYIKIDDWAIIGASPELLVKVEDNTIILRPIAGTRHRGNSEQEDHLLENELLADKKECAEHLMLVDLGRNDVGKVSKFGTVKVHEFMQVEKYSHVMHIISEIHGKKRQDVDLIDALLSGFPAGTLTGAPKIRAMEIIHNLEKAKRNIYGGAVGFVDFCGNMNTCIAIRTMVVKDGIAYFQAGAGIVYDSDPEKEYHECINKAKAINAAIDFAENGLVT